MKEVKQALEEVKEVMTKQLPDEVLEVFSRSIVDLKNNINLKSVIGIGDMFPKVSLLTEEGDSVTLEELYASDKLVISFVRGSWCPFCSVEVSVLMKYYQDIKQKGAEVVLVTPQQFTYNKDWKSKGQFPFRILQDKNNMLSNLLGISFELQNYAVPYYNELGIDLTLINNDFENKLPIPAIYVINKEGVVTYTFEDINYMNRVEIDELMNNI